jgi:hypothetical protein
MVELIINAHACVLLEKHATQCENKKRDQSLKSDLFLLFDIVKI